MAITVPAHTTWSVVTADAAVAQPFPTATAGDRIFVFAAWKAFGTTAQITSPQAFTEVTEFADGSVAVGSGTGSVKVGAWYRDWQSGDGNPTVDWSVAPVPGATCALRLSKAAGETWDTPTFVTGVITTAANPWSSTSTSTLTVKDGALVMEVLGIRDSSATMTRDSNTALDDDGSPAVTWNGNVVEIPVGHASSETSNDIAADLIHRFVTTGAAAVNLTATATMSAVETGAILWVHQGVTAGESHSGSASLTGGGVATVGGQKGGQSVTALTGGGTVVAVGQHAGQAAVVMTGGGTTPSAETSAHVGTGSLTGGGVIGQTVRKGGQSPAALTGGGVITQEAEADVGAESHSGTAVLTGGGMISASVLAARFGAALLSGGGTISVVAEVGTGQQVGGVPPVIVAAQAGVTVGSAVTALPAGRAARYGPRISGGTSA